MLSLSSWSLFPLPRISISIHNDSLNLANCSMVTGSDFSSSHLWNTDCNSLTLSWHDNYLISNIYLIVISYNSWNHKFCTITNCIDRRILNDNSFMVSKDKLKWFNNSSNIGLIFVVIISPLCIKNIVHSNKVLALNHNSTSIVKIMWDKAMNINGKPNPRSVIDEIDQQIDAI